MARNFVFGLTLLLIFHVSAAPAHYLFVIAKNTGKNRLIHLYFEESPRPGDGKYLDPFVKRGVTWIRTLEQNKPRKVKLTEVKNQKRRWLSAPIKGQSPVGVESYGKWGVYRYGKTDVLLHYYARFLDVDSGKQLKKLARASHLKLDIVPSLKNGTVQLRVLWEGQPVEGRPLYVRGIKGAHKNLKTNEEGMISLDVSSARRFTCRTYVEEKQSGTDDGKQYDLVRYHCSLTMSLPKSANNK